MDWTDCQLHQFIIRGKRYGVSRVEGPIFSDNAGKVQLSDFNFRVHERFLYEYDFGDLWQHESRVEKQLPLDPNKTYPVCISGVRLAPPEDCGGAWAFMAQKQHYSWWYIEERLLEMLASENLYEELDYCREELIELKYWLSAERFERHAVHAV